MAEHTRVTEAIQICFRNFPAGEIGCPGSGIFAVVSLRTFNRTRNPSLRPYGSRRADYATPLYPQTLALPSPTSDGRSVGIVRSRTRAMEFVCFLFRLDKSRDSTSIRPCPALFLAYLIRLLPIILHSTLSSQVTAVQNEAVTMRRYATR
jgi:hypothetical protein